jgi:hypothetical protein
MQITPITIDTGLFPRLSTASGTPVNVAMILNGTLVDHIINETDFRSNLPEYSKAHPSLIRTIVSNAIHDAVEYYVDEIGAYVHPGEICLAVTDLYNFAWSVIEERFRLETDQIAREYVSDNSRPEYS